MLIRFTENKMNIKIKGGYYYECSHSLSIFNYSME
jgi:hypothetical protein